MRQKSTKNYRKDLWFLLALMLLTILNLMRSFEFYDSGQNFKFIIVVAYIVFYIFAVTYTYMKWRKSKSNKY